MKWPHKGLSLILISLSLLFVGFSAAVAQEELDENLETEEGFYGEGEEDESAVASEEAADSELVKNDEEEDEEKEDEEQGTDSTTADIDEDEIEEDTSPVEEPMDLEDVEEPTFASPPPSEEDENSSIPVYSSIEKGRDENLPPSRTQEPKIDPRATKEQKVPHPYADKGLVRITHDKIYLYRTPVSEQKRASSVRFGFFDPTDLASPDTDVAFSSLYPESDMPIMFYDYEWQLWQGFGKLGWKLGTGLYAASGNGAFKSTDNAALTPRENFTFIAFPNSVSVIYRLQYWDTQPVVPYIEGGGDAITFAEVRDDGKSPKFGLAPAVHIAGGASFNLGFLDGNSMIELDREYGINRVWLTGEFRALIGLSDKFDFSANVINLGFLVEF